MNQENNSEPWNEIGFRQKDYPSICPRNIHLETLSLEESISVLARVDRNTHKRFLYLQALSMARSVNHLNRCLDLPDGISVGSEAARKSSEILEFCKILDDQFTPEQNADFLKRIGDGEIKFGNLFELFELKTAGLEESAKEAILLRCLPAFGFTKKPHEITQR